MENKLQVNITEEDVIVCECGQSKFIVVDSYYKAKNPIIGQPPIIGPVGDPLLICPTCNKVLSFEQAETLKNKEKEIKE